MKLKELLKGMEARIPRHLPEADIKHVSADSGRVRKGSLFVAIRGSEFDGHEFIGKALKKGAGAAISERALAGNENVIRVRDSRKALSRIAKNFYGAPAEKLKTIGITGTNGKTTVSFLAESILKEAGMPAGLIGTIGYRSGRNIAPAAGTTPGPLELNRILYGIAKKKMKAVVMEVSSHALDQGRTADIFFDTAIFTNLTAEHLDYHRNMREYLSSKARIFANLKKDGFAVLNADDKNVKKCEKSVPAGNRVTYGLKKPAEVTAEVIKSGLDGSCFIIKAKNRVSFPINTRLPGLYNVSNILAAAATGIAWGISPAVIKRGIEKVNNISGRLEPVEAGQPFRVFVDYAHTHGALLNVLKCLKSNKTGRIITVFGCGGERDRKKRPLMGLVASRFSDYVIVTDDNPRREDPGAITGQIEKGINKKNVKYDVIHDRRKAIEKALKTASAGDIVLIAGKGHEKSQIIGTTAIPFDDKQVTMEVLSRQVTVSTS